MPSRASTDAAYEPPGPPPTINVVHFSGIDMVLNVADICVDQRAQRLCALGIDDLAEKRKLNKKWLGCILTCKGRIVGLQVSEGIGRHDSRS